MTARTLVFLHIPKTAGATLHRVIERAYPGEPTETLQLLVEGADGLPAALSEERRAELRVLKGHLPFGVHRHLPREVDYVTFLRHPIARVRSLYRYVLTETRHPLHAEVRDRGMSLVEFVRSGIDHSQTHDGQVRQLVDGRGRDLGTADLELATQRLEHEIAVVGLQESFDESLLLLRRGLGWRRPPLYLRRNVTKGHDATLAGPDDEALLEHNALDLELWERARRLVDARVSDAPLLGAELTGFRLLNRAATQVQERRT